MSDKMHVTLSMPYLRCVKAIEACPELEVGDLIWAHTREIWDGGYEYVVASRRGDGEVIKFRVDHLDDCFVEEDVEDEHWI